MERLTPDRMETETMSNYTCTTVVHYSPGADVRGVCGQSVAVRGHVGAHSITHVVPELGETACGACHLIVTAGLRPRHAASRNNPESLNNDALVLLREMMTGVKYLGGKHAAEGVAA